MRKFKKKATNKVITENLLRGRTSGLIAHGYDKPKWIVFCEALMARGYVLTLYEARRTFSKYITVQKEGFPPFKVRFSNHKPILERELNGDCDFFVGVTNLRVTHTGMALAAVQRHFSGTDEIFN